MSHRHSRNQLALVDLRGVTYRYPEFVLGPIDLIINPGSRVALVGRNGAGKTTLLNLLSGNLAAAEGTARLLGTARAAPDPSLRQDVALVPTELLALRWMKVRQHFDFVANFYDNWDSARALALADSLDLDVNARVGSLSRGNSLKVALCSALGQGARLLLLDEPTAGLDPVARLEMLRRLDSHLQAHPEVSMMFATHILEDLDDLDFTQMLVLREGSMAAEKTREVAKEGGGLRVAARRMLLTEGETR